MKNNNNIEIILLSNTSLANSHQQELVKWLTTVQSIIGKQQATTKKLFLSALKGLPAIYLS